jgi:hypothetical protein
MKIYIGDEFDINFKIKINWIRTNFNKDQYQIIDEGFLINDYYVKFTEERYGTLYLLQWD